MTGPEFVLAFYLLPMVLVSVIFRLVNMSTVDPEYNVPSDVIAFFSLIPIVNVVIVIMMAVLILGFMLYTFVTFPFGRQK